jgi:hypothetical protein
MVHFNGKLFIDEDGEICIHGKIAVSNPTAYDLPLKEIWEEYFNEEVSIEILKLEQRWKKAKKNKAKEGDNK